MKNIPATEFKAKCLDLMDRVAEKRETFIITKRGAPVAKLTPVDAKAKDTLFGCFRSQLAIAGDVVQGKMPVENWETVREWDELITRRKRKSQTAKTVARKSGRAHR
jgi:prevent-host-death family protein